MTAVKNALTALSRNRPRPDRRRGQHEGGARVQGSTVRAAALSYFAGRSGDIIIIPKENWLLAPTATTHGTLYPYDQRVPDLLRRDLNPGPRDDAATPADVAVTLGVDRRRQAPLSGRTRFSRERSADYRMNRWLVRIAGVCLALSSAVLFTISPSAQAPRKLATISPASTRELREWDAETAAMLRTGDLRVRQTRADTLLAGRMTRRADQYYKGVRVFGARCGAAATAGRDPRDLRTAVRRHRPGDCAGAHRRPGARQDSPGSPAPGPRRTYDLS